MGRCIVKLADEKYVEWSSIVDAPVTYIFDRKGMKEWLDAQYGLSSVEENEKRLARADKHGTSMLGPHYENVEQFITCNRAGENEEFLTLKEIIERYTLKEEKNG